MADLKILVPEGTTNYIENPSMRFATTDWNAVGSTLTRVLDYARFGIASLKIITAGAALNEGAYYRVNDLSGINDAVVASVYVRGTGKIQVRLIDNPTGEEWKSSSVMLRDDLWQRVSVVGRSTGTNDMRLYIETADDTAKAVTMYVDAAQMEIGGYLTTYCDGNQPGCRWNGVWDASTSTRSAYTRAGGRWVTMSGKGRDLEDIYMTVSTGMGVASVYNNRQSYSHSPGGFLDNVKINERSISMNFHVKNKSIPRTVRQVNSLKNLHKLRQTLIDVIKPDKTGGNEPFWIEYKDGDKPLYLQAHYNGGLEGDWDVRNKYVMSFQVLFIAPSPLMIEDDQDNYKIDFSDSNYFKGVAGRIDGEWSDLNGGMWYSTGIYDGLIRQFALGPKGEVYAAGRFNVVNDKAGALNQSAPACSAARWTGEQWESFDVSITPADAIVYAIAVAPNGDVYVGGSFTNIGIVAAAGIAKYDPNTEVVSALGAGVTGGNVLAIRVAPNGDVYAGGSFTSAGGNAANYIARWDGSSWQEVGAQVGLNQAVYDLEITKDGKTIYVGGDFTDENNDPGTLTEYVCQYDVASNVFSALGLGFDSSVYRAKLSDAGELYVAGAFTLCGTQSMKYIAKWNGSMFVPMGANDRTTGVRDMSINKDGDILICWNDNELGPTQNNTGAEIWNGSAFTYVDVQPKTDTASSIALIYACIYDAKGDIFFGGEHFGFATGDAVTAYYSTYSAITYIENEGSAEVSPKIYIKGEGRLRYIENQSTKKKILFNLDILEGEEVFIDFGAGKFYSTTRGDLFYSLEQGSDFRGFTLIPGENKIATFISNDVGAMMYMYFTPTHWSSDATQHGESL